MPSAAAASAAPVPVTVVEQPTAPVLQASTVEQESAPVPRFIFDNSGKNHCDSDKMTAPAPSLFGNTSEPPAANGFTFGATPATNAGESMFGGGSGTNGSFGIAHPERKENAVENGSMFGGGSGTNGAFKFAPLEGKENEVENGQSQPTVASTHTRSTRKRSRHNDNDEPPAKRAAPY